MENNENKEQKITLSDFSGNIKGAVDKLVATINDLEEDRTRQFGLSRLLCEKWTLEELVEIGCSVDYAKTLKGGE